MYVRLQPGGDTDACGCHHSLKHIQHLHNSVCNSRTTGKHDKQGQRTRCGAAFTAGCCHCCCGHCGCMPGHTGAGAAEASCWGGCTYAPVGSVSWAAALRASRPPGNGAAASVLPGPAGGAEPSPSCWGPCILGPWRPGRARSKIDWSRTSMHCVTHGPCALQQSHAERRWPPAASLLRLRCGLHLLSFGTERNHPAMNISSARDPAGVQLCYISGEHQAF